MRKAFIYLYFIFILSQFMIGQIYLPGLPLNILQMSALLLLLFCILIDRKIPHDRYIVMYLFFLFFYLISSVLTGYTDIIYGSVFPQFLISLTAFWGTKILVQRYSTLLPLVIPAMIAGVVDSVVTMSQAIGKPILSPIILLLMQNPDAIELASDGMLGVSVSGLFMNPVFNGHSLLFCFVCSLFSLQGRYKLVGFLSSIIILVGLFFCQQRSAFFLSILALIMIGWKVIKNSRKGKLLVILLSIVAYFYLLPRVQSYAIDSGSRLTDLSISSREEIWGIATSYLSDNILIGGFEMFTHHYGVYPHNIFLSAFLAGGLIGGVILLLLICILLYKVGKIYINYKKLNISLLVSATLMFVLIVDSFSHNTGFVEADFSTFLAMSLCYYYNERNPYKHFKTV